MVQTEVYNEQNVSFLYYRGILQDVTVGNYDLWLCESQKGTHYLQIRFIDSDNFDSSSEPCKQYCRKWILEPTMSKTEIVRTAYKAFEAAVVHEMSERFLYKGVAIFNPHADVELLCGKTEPVKETD
jgi:hypothetical protein